MKRFAAITLAVLMLLTVFASAAIAADDNTYSSKRVQLRFAVQCTTAQV